jgi:integrase
MEHPDPLDDTALKAPLRPATVRHRRGQVLRFASVLVHAGVEPSKISGLKALVTPALAKTGLAWLHARQGGKKSPGLAGVAIMLKTLARHHVPCSPEDLKEIVTYSNRLAMPGQTGLTPKNRERLRPFEDPAMQRRLLTLPAQLLEQTKGKTGPRAALMREEALAISLLLHCPVRLRNLANLHLERNLRRMRDGRVYLVFDGSEVKNRRPLEFELPRSVIAMLDAHLATRAPELCPPGTPWLYPRRDGGAAMAASHLSRRISARIHKETGLVMHVHLFRHFAAKIFLEANPGQYEVVRRLLGHAALSSTLSAYTGFEAGTAIRLYNEVLTQAQRGAR